MDMSIEKLSEINRIREVLYELSNIDSITNDPDMESCKELIKDYFINIKPSIQV